MPPFVPGTTATKHQGQTSKRSGIFGIGLPFWKLPGLPEALQVLPDGLTTDPDPLRDLWTVEAREIVPQNHLAGLPCAALGSVGNLIAHDTHRTFRL